MTLQYSGAMMLAISFREGQMVKTPDGRIGMIVSLRALGESTITFGAQGPTALYDWKSLKFASDQEIKDAGLEGVERLWSYGTQEEDLD